MQTQIKKVTKIYIIAGEVSGDRIGAGLINALKTLYGREIQIFGIGGAYMAAQGLQSLFTISQIILKGFFEIFPHFFKIKMLINKNV